MYREKIAKLAPGYDPAHVEAHLRVLLDLRFESSGMSPESMTESQFEAGVKLAVMGIDAFDDLAISDRLAKSYGLKPKKRKGDAVDALANSFGLRPQPRKATK